ncbi:glycosyltransferase family 4 protein [Spiribacter halobius]|uniref:Glycosyl transferase family 1 n=1 Tax=Sediminicurvatus halobius TaxID=2182432 RepID=A0A2U2N0P0_9GAMM|nr:glycosyltransferase family 4 protein [Spiribacter halobius]PWG62680.1 glycosyl transferase family 1 [Spiribacter halobius]UEX77349.1 glycosyltransferase family 4 protein [Spiribacter halobius]
MQLSRLRIGLVGPLPPPEGGMANQTRQLGELLAGEGHAVELVAVNADYRPRWVAGLRGLRALFRLIPYLVHLWRMAGRAEVVHVMANSGWSWHLFAAPAVWIARLRGVPTVVNYRGGQAPEFLARSAWLVRPTLRRAGALVVPSGFLRDVFGAHGLVAEVLPNIIDRERFCAAAGRRDGGPRLLVARNLEPLYGVDTALRAFASLRERYPDAQLIVAGGGPSAERLLALAASLGVAQAVTFTGRVGVERMAALYRDADVLLNPSRADNMPNALLEAMASGVPIVSTNVGGVPYMVEHGRTALLVPVDDAYAMAKAAERLLEDAVLHARLRRAGLEEASRYAWPQVRERLLDVYERAAHGGPSATAVSSG